MKEIFIFDIDGCILHSKFPDIHDNGQSKENIIKEVLTNGNKVSLFPEFIEYYEKSCKAAETIFFMTGRQKSSLGELTESQLSPLNKIKPFQMIYYPEGKSHMATNYFNWKVNQQVEIFKKYNNSELHNEGSQSKYIFKIFDDMKEYFPRIIAIADEFKIQISLKHVNSPEGWIAVIKE